MPILKRIEEGELTAALEQKSESAVIESLKALSRLQKTQAPLFMNRSQTR